MNHFRRYYPYRIPLEICCKAVSGKSSNDARGQGKSKESNPKANAIVTTAACPFGERKRIVELAGKFWFPAIYFQQEFVDEGGPYGVDFDDLYKRAAVYGEDLLVNFL